MAAVRRTRPIISYWLAALAGLTILRLVLAATLPLTPDEAYYWIWSVHLQPGYYDHPPMVALWIRIGTSLFGNTALGIRLLGPLAAAAGSFFIWQAGETLLPNRSAGLLAASLFNATVLLGAGSIIMTPDTPLVFFWSATLAAMGTWLATRDPRWWLAVGAASGAALLSKYTGLLLIVAIGGFMITQPDGRTALRTPWPWLGLLLAVALFAPNIAWNATHGWVSYIKQGSRETSFDVGRSAQFLGELVIGQIALATPIIFGLAAYGLWRLRRVPEPAARLLLWLALVPAAVLLEHVLSGRVEANWPAIIYPAACLAAAALPEDRLLAWARPALGLGFMVTLCVYAQALAAPFPLRATADPVALQLAGWPDLAARIPQMGQTFETSDEYATSAELAFYANPGAVIAGFGPRWQYVGLVPSPQIFRRSGIMISRRADAPCAGDLAQVSRRRGGAVVSRYHICDFAAPGALFILPRP